MRKPGGICALVEPRYSGKFLGGFPAFAPTVRSSLEHLSLCAGDASTCVVEAGGLEEANAIGKADHVRRDRCRAPTRTLRSTFLPTSALPSLVS
jgi:hypothetical protein